MKAKGIVGEIVGELKETVKQAGQEVKGQAREAAQEVVVALTGGVKSQQKLSKLEEKERQEKAKRIAHYQRVLKAQQEAEGGRRTAAFPETAVENKEFLAEKAEGIVTPPSGPSRYPGSGFKKSKKRAEFRDFKNS